MAGALQEDPDAAVPVRGYCPAKSRIAWSAGASRTASRD